MIAVYMSLGPKDTNLHHQHMYSDVLDEIAESPTEKSRALHVIWQCYLHAEVLQTQQHETLCLVKCKCNPQRLAPAPGMGYLSNNDRHEPVLKATYWHIELDMTPSLNFSLACACRWAIILILYPKFTKCPDKMYIGWWWSQIGRLRLVCIMASRMCWTYMIHNTTLHMHLIGSAYACHPAA